MGGCILKKEELIINTIVFKDRFDRGDKQIDILKTLKDMGIKRVEIRRELLTDVKAELQAIKQKADELGLCLFYSINENLFVDGIVNPKLNNYFEEVDILKAPFLKMNIGNAKDVPQTSWDYLYTITQKCKPIKVENNQDLHNARISNCLEMMQQCQAHNIPISFVFDVSNWVFVGEDPKQAAIALADYSDYLHCKNYKRVEDELLGTTLFDGDIDIIDFLKHFPHMHYLALEYPCTEKELSDDITQLLNN